LTPQGTLAEKSVQVAREFSILTPAGVGTTVADGRIRIYDGKEYVLEEALRADFALVRAKADKFGNLVYNKRRKILIR
jgi:3-oxoacid CoA-transferase subunit A